MEKPSYKDFTHWKKYQRFFPDRARITAEREPTEEWWKWRDSEIHLDRFTRPDTPLTIILVHGGGGYGRMLAPIGYLLFSHGYEVVAPDLPGYGLSSVPSKLFSHEYWVECLVDLVATERKRSQKPVVLVGASLGGYLSYLAAAKSRAVSGIVTTTLADPRLSLVKDQFARNRLISRLGVPTMPFFDVLLGDLHLPIKWFSKMHAIANDPELTEVVVSDSLGGGNRVPLRFMRSLFEIEPALEPEEFDLCPILLAHPADDRWTTIEASRLFFDRLKGKKSCVMLEGCGHIPVEEPGISQMEQAICSFLEKVP